MKEKRDTEFAEYVDLAFERFGGKALYANDEFFAEKENLLKPGRGIFIEDKYTDRGKWMDGWESRRKRGPGHDFCIIKLAFPGVIRGFDIDTNHFTGNHPPFASVDACELEGDPDGYFFSKEKPDWQEVLKKSPLASTSQNKFHVEGKSRVTHIRLNIYPDGGVARFRVYGEVLPNFKRVRADEVIELSGIQNGGRAIACSDMHYSAMGNLLLPGRGVNMGDGWETKRRRGPGFDWVIIKLGHVGKIDKLEIDTCHFKGNFPDSGSVQGGNFKGGEIPSESSKQWQEVLPQTKLAADKQHFFSKELQNTDKAYTHVKLNSYPDGGVSRFRIFGTLANET